MEQLCEDVTKLTKLRVLVLDISELVKKKLRNVKTLTQNDNRASADCSETDENDNDEYDGHAIDSRGEDDFSRIIIFFSKFFILKIS